MTSENTSNYERIFMRIVSVFDRDETAREFLTEDGDGGFGGAIYRMAREIDRLRSLTAAEQAKPAPAADAPLGAVENGRVFLQRLVDHYDFQCEAGGLANCSDYHEAVRCFEAMAEWIYHHAPAARSGAVNEKAVMVCPQCEGEGEYADGLDEAACSTPCTRCDGNGWIVDFSAIDQAEPALAAPCKHPVWGQDNDGTRVCAKCGLVERPSARSGAVKVKAILELVQYHVTDDDDRASLTTAISALEPAEAALAERDKENAALREALEPFARVADLIDVETEGLSDDDEINLLFHDYLMDRYTVADFRRARNAGGKDA